MVKSIALAVQKVYCPKCEQYKPPGEFTTRLGDRSYSTCRDCRRTYGRIWMREHRATTHAAVWETLYAAAGNRCARCGYHEFEAAFEFHSVAERDPSPTVLLSDAVNRYVYSANQNTWDDLLAKMEGHVLLCANCRKALRAHAWEIDETNRVRIGLINIPDPPHLGH